MKKARTPPARSGANKRAADRPLPRLNGNDGIPLYKQIAATLSDRIRSNELNPGDMMPSETQLREEFRVSRVTVRQAIMELARTGSVTSRQGKGTFVTLPTVAQRFRGRTQTLIEAFSAAGVEPEVAIVSLEQVTPPPHVAAVLGSGTEMVVRICRSYTVDKSIVAATCLFLALPMSGVAHILAQRENTRESSYTIIEQRMGIEIGIAKHAIQTVLLDRLSADMLGMQEGEVCLSMDRVTYAQKGHVLQFMRFFYPPGRMCFEITTARRGPGIELRVPAQA
jgi:GntR family transcriptional regulator